MPLMRRIARPMLSTIFIYGGANALKQLEGHAKAAEPFLDRISDRLPNALPREPQSLVKLDAAVKVGAGLMLALGKQPRIAALLLAGSLVPTTLAGHAFWETDDPAERAAQRIHFGKNLSLIGGLLIAAGDTEGKPSLGWRARHVTGSAGHRVHHVARTASDYATDAAESVRDALPVG